MARAIIVRPGGQQRRRWPDWAVARRAVRPPLGRAQGSDEGEERSYRGDLIDQIGPLASQPSTQFVLDPSQHGPTAPARHRTQHPAARHDWQHPTPS